MSNLKVDLIGKKYPIRDIDNNIISFKTITSVIILTSHSSVIIGVDNSDPSIMISYGYALRLLEGNF